jgi:hypothetical protein
MDSFSVKVLAREGEIHFDKEFESIYPIENPYNKNVVLQSI